MQTPNIDEENTIFFSESLKDKLEISNQSDTLTDPILVKLTFVNKHIFSTLSKIILGTEEELETILPKEHLKELISLELVSVGIQNGEEILYSRHTKNVKKTIQIISSDLILLNLKFPR